MRLFYRIKELPKDLKRGIKSFWYWRKIIWYNNWWDSGYLLILMKHQIELMEKNWVKNTIHMGDSKIKMQMQEVLRALDALIEDRYEHDSTNYDTWSEYCKEVKRRRNEHEDIVFNTIRDNYIDWWD